jgi:hypothetical protein
VRTSFSVRGDEPLADLDGRDAELGAERVEQRLLVHEAEMHDRPAEPPAPAALVRERALELHAVEPPLLDEQLPDRDAAHVRLLAKFGSSRCEGRAGPARASRRAVTSSCGCEAPRSTVQQDHVA